MLHALKGKKVVCLVEADFEDLELWYPVMRLREGEEVLLAGPSGARYIKVNTGFPRRRTFPLMNWIPKS